MKACVTGGAGFIGSHLVERLVRDGHEVTVLDSLVTGSLSNLEAVSRETRFIKCDLSRASRRLPALLEGADCVFHLAALPSVVASLEAPLRSHAHCGTATLVLLDAMKRAGVRRIVYSSSCAVYGDRAELPWRTDMAPLPTSPYAADKLAGEYYLRVYHRVYDFAATALRYFNVYGPRQPANTPYAAVIPNFVKALAEGSPATIYGDGTQTRDFVHVADVVESNLLAASRTSGFGVFNIATGHATSIQQVFQLMAWHCPGAPKPVYAPQRKGEIVHSYAETAETVEHIGFRARIGLADGLAELLGSYCQSASR